MVSPTSSAVISSTVSLELSSSELLLIAFVLVVVVVLLPFGEHAINSESFLLVVDAGATKSESFLLFLLKVFA